ncbi:hypothetical protein EG832_20035, partial [bacterium]|nr:hypothetical protein [bacterium]
MRSIAIIAFLTLLVMPCIAEPDSVITGSYKVTFDLGIPKEAYRIEIADPATRESSHNECDITLVKEHDPSLNHQTGIICISLASSNTEQFVYTQDYLVKSWEYDFSQNPNYYNAKVVKIKIDGCDGIFARATIGAIIGSDMDSYWAVYD